jgi:peptidoglycan/xylan/chitin deacetylase (PgdA/CDA1 family)
LRDDDAHEPGLPLDRLLALMRRYQAHCLVAVIPARAGEPLAQRLRGEPLARIAVHGFEHKNNALEGSRAEEMAVALGMEIIRERLTSARNRLISLFGEGAGHWYVPPWNRIAPSVAAELPDLGYRAISTFAGQSFNLGERLAELNTHVDFIDWKRGRIGHEGPVLAAKLAAELEKARQEGFRPVGLLTHHLAHDETVWSCLESVLAIGATHPAAGWEDPGMLLTSGRNPV